LSASLGLTRQRPSGIIRPAKPMLQRQLYDLHAERDPQTGCDQPSSLAPRERELIEWLQEQLPVRDQLQIVELGCGDGSLSLAMERALSAKVLGVDLAAANVERARQRAGNISNLEFRELNLDSELASLASESADVVVGIDVLEHVFDVFGFAANVARILRPGGLAALRVPNIAYVKHRLSLLRGTLPVTSSWFGPSGDYTAWRTRWGWDGGHLHYFTLESLRALLLGAGLQPLGFRDPGARFARVRRFAPALLAGNLAVLARK
jgi:2-polyprenyl-3-methyl-5-hydroxy-6-metoxy-1,4-benzoquinol methylase